MKNIRKFLLLFGIAFTRAQIIASDEAATASTVDLKSVVDALQEKLTETEELYKLATMVTTKTLQENQDLQREISGLRSSTLQSTENTQSEEQRELWKEKISEWNKRIEEFEKAKREAILKEERELEKKRQALSQRVASEYADSQIIRDRIQEEAAKLTKDIQAALNEAEKVMDTSEYKIAEFISNNRRLVWGTALTAMLIHDFYKGKERVPFLQEGFNYAVMGAKKYIEQRNTVTLGGLSCCATVFPTVTSSHLKAAASALKKHIIDPSTTFLKKHPVATGAAVITGLLAFDCYRGKDQLPYLQAGFNGLVHNVKTNGITEVATYAALGIPLLLLAKNLHIITTPRNNNYPFRSAHHW